MSAMDEEYASPDSDGHASLPSPTDTTFDLSQIPLRHRSRAPDPTTVSSSFVRTPEDDDSYDDSEGDVSFNSGGLPRQSYRMLDTSPLLQSASKSHSKILTPMNSRNDNNTPRNTSRHVTQTPRNLQLGSPGQGENIDPKQGQGSGRKPSPPRLVLHKPDYGTSDEGEETVMDKTAPIALDSARERLTKAGATKSMDPVLLNTLFGDTYERSVVALPAAPSTPDAKVGPPKRAILRGRRNSPPKIASPVVAPPSHPPSASPQHDSPQLPAPSDNVHHLTPGTPHLRYYNWLSSDDADDESHEIPAGHSSRLKKAQAQRIVDETAFLGGDEASLLVADTSVNNEMLDVLHVRGPANGGREALEGNSELKEARLADFSKESIPIPPLRPMLGRSTHVAPGSEARTVGESIDGRQNLQPAHDITQYVEDDNTQHSISSAESVRQQPNLESRQSDDQPRPRSPSSVYRESATESTTADAVDSGSITPTHPDIAALMRAAPPTGSLPKETGPPDLGFTPGNSPTMPQGSVSVSDSTKRAIESTFLLGGSLTPRQSLPSDATVRPTTSPGQLQENSTAAAFARSPSREYPEGDVDAFPETHYQTSLYSDGFVAHSTPQDYYAGYDIWAIKKSSRGRRVSMNTPPSTLGHSVSGTEFLDNPPEFSSLGSGFSFPSQPLRYEKWEPESVRREFTPPFPVEGLDGLKRQGLGAGRLHGADAPHNTPTPSAGKGSGAPAGWRKGKNMKEGKGRARSKSDPVEKKMGGKGLKRLFTQGRVEKEKMEPEYIFGEEGRHNDRHDNPNDAATGIRDKSNLSDESELLAVEQDDELDSDDGLGLSDTDDNDGADGRHWSGFTQDFRSSFTRGNKDISVAVGQSEPSHDPSNMSLGNVEFRVHTPASIGDSKDVSHNGDVGDGSNKTLWLRMAQAETENDRFRKLLESNNIKIGDQDLGSSGNLTVVHDSRDLSNSRSSDYNTFDDLSSLRRRVMELEGLLESLGRRDAELRGENERKDVLILHWRTRHDDVQKLAEQNRQRALGLEGRVKGLEQQAAVDNINHDREINEVVSKLHGEKQHSRQKSLGLEDRAEFYEQRVHEVQEAHRRDAEEKDRTISQLQQALDSKKGPKRPVEVELGLSSDQHLVAELQEKLFKQQKAYEAEAQLTEDKYTNLLSEQEGLVRHLQAELDEMVNLMPVDHGSSRMIDEEEAEDWLDEKSREISQYYDDGLGEIITELHGTGEVEDFEEAVEEAEMSLRRVADEAGFCEPLDRVRLAAFGIRQLRSEYDVLKRLLIESETRVKDLLQANDELGSGCRETQEKLKFAIAERDAFRTAAKEAEAAGNILANQVEALRAKLQEAENHIHQLVAEHDALNQRCSDAEERVESLEADKVSLQRLVNDTKRLNDMLKSQVAEAGQRDQGFEEEISGLRKQLAEEKDHVSVVETETITFRQQLTEWEESATAIGKQRDGFQLQLKESADRIKAIEKEKQELSKKLLEASKGQGNEKEGNEKEANAFKKQVKKLQNALKVLEEQQSVSSATITQLEQKIAQSDQSAQRLSAEKGFLKAELEIAVGETKAARGRFAQLLHDTAEKEAKWASLKQEMEPSVTKTSGNPISTIEAYRKSLALIVQEIEKDSAHTLVEDDQPLDINAAEGIQDPELVKVVIQAFRWRDKRLAESEERNTRYKGAAKKCMKEQRGRVEELLAEVRELKLELKAEKKSSDEKLGQLILALRRGE